jgi:hypothetical protein
LPCGEHHYRIGAIIEADFVFIFFRLFAASGALQLQTLGVGLDPPRQTRKSGRSWGAGTMLGVGGKRGKRLPRAC